MFRKKQGDDDGARKPERNGEAAHDLAAPPLKPFSRRGSHVPAKPPSAPAMRQDLPPRRGVEPAAAPRRYDRLRAGGSESKKLTVGRDIVLSGEISSCDRLVVEGRVEVQLNEARIIEITSTGVFRGSAEVEEADISGLYEGELVAREVLTVRSGGRINGTVRYGRIIIEAGGEISGDMRALAQAPEAPRRGLGQISVEAVEDPADGAPDGPEGAGGPEEKDADAKS